MQIKTKCNEIKCFIDILPWLQIWNFHTRICSQWLCVLWPLYIIIVTYLDERVVTTLLVLIYMSPVKIDTLNNTRYTNTIKYSNVSPCRYQGKPRDNWMQIYQQNLTNLQTSVFGRQLVKMDKTIKQLNKAGETQANKFDISHKIVTPGTS